MTPKLPFYWPLGTYAVIIFGRYLMYRLLLAFGISYLAVGLILEWLVRTTKRGDSG